METMSDLLFFPTMANGSLFAILGWMTISDLRTRSIPAWAPWGMALVGILLNTVPERTAGFTTLLQMEEIPLLLLRFLPGGAAAILSAASGEAVGKGDCGTLLALAFWLDAGVLSRITLASVFFCGFCGILLMAVSVIRGSGISGIRKTRIPYLPFLSAAVVWQVLTV